MLTVTKKAAAFLKVAKVAEGRRAVPESGSEKMRYLSSSETRASDSQLARSPILTIGSSSRKGSASL